MWKSGCKSIVMFCKSSVLTTSYKNKQLICISYLFACWLSHLQEWLLRLHPTFIPRLMGNCCHFTEVLLCVRVVAVLALRESMDLDFPLWFSEPSLQTTIFLSLAYFCFCGVSILHLFFYFYAFSVCNCVFQFSSLMCPFFLSGNLPSLLGWRYNNILMHYNCVST